MYVNDAVINSSNNSGSFGQAIVQKLTKPSNALTVNDIKASANPTSASIVNQATGVVTTQKQATGPQKESGAIITKSNDTSGSIFDNKYVLYGGIGIIAFGLLYFMTQD